jgi:hypothetical protein
MQRLKLILLISISMVTLMSCGKTEVTETAKLTNSSETSVSKSPEGDIYSMEYRLCGKECREETSQIITWDKPTEIGIAYYDDLLPNNVDSKPITSMKQRRINSTYFVVKCKGTLPGLEKPLTVNRFAPVEIFYNIAYPGEGTAAKPIGELKYGRIEIVAIKKLPRTQVDNPGLLARETLLKKINDPFMVAPNRLGGYLEYSVNKPEIKPQQVDPITWQEGQSPQIIPVRTW